MFTRKVLDSQSRKVRTEFSLGATLGTLGVAVGLFFLGKGVL